jgi:hypothetical protein
MPTLHLGVIELPYNQAPFPRQKQTRAGTVTTGDVATWLEDRYHVMENFFLLHEVDIADDVAGSVKGTVESLLLGAPASLDPFGTATSKIEDRMKQFISQGEMDRLGYPGVPTQAALDRASGRRRSSRFKRKRATGKAISFYDSGLYQSSMKAWVDR